MPAVEPSGVPDITIKQVIEQGVTALSGNVALLDDIWAKLSSADRTRLKQHWTDHPPTVLLGFARLSSPFPVFAITLAEDANETMLLDDGEMFDEEEEDEVGREVVRCTFRIYVYAENPDVCAAYYRALRRILQVGRRKLESFGLMNPTISGGELAPDPAYTPDNLFTRQVTLVVLIDEAWSLSDDLATALRPTEEPRLSADGTLIVRHVDAGGGVEPVDPE